MNSRTKGKRGERDGAKAWTEHTGIPMRRSVQYCGRAGDADLVGMQGVHLEVKHVEKLNVYEAMAQAMGDAKDGNVPIVLHRRNRFQWLITLCLCDVREFCGLLAKADGKPIYPTEDATCCESARTAAATTTTTGPT